MITAETPVKFDRKKLKKVLKITGISIAIILLPLLVGWLQACTKEELYGLCFLLIISILMSGLLRRLK